ncbi:DNA-directed RNA polymerase [Diplogelasinospora grovesii]|uniref:DNA-directed RNA polymerase III subunit RPC6 n=1 Tax=Diplogelasinospora grovesii TaxID=303347 RepID=A0AAN6S9Q3_9PEZI|nr:DNA-directed RNA polymerase [Diplogelasinospora grovesii]
MAAAENDAAKLQILKDALYDEVRQHGSETRQFSQKDLLDLNVIPHENVALLLRVVQGLCDDKLFIGTTGHVSGIAWRWRSREDAKKYTSLPNDETMMVYSVIDEAGADGIWNRTIKHRLNMHEAVVKNCIKYLESHQYITSMKNVEHPNKKMYIKANLRPSDRATGGPWFTDGELDTAFITELEMIVFEYIKNHSAYLSSVSGHPTATRVPKKSIKGPTTNGSAEEARGVKRPATEITNDDTAAPHPSTAKSSTKSKAFLPLPAGYRQYPTVTEIAQFIHDTGITNNTTLGEADIQQLVDVLMYDGLIEPLRVDGRKGYRVTKAAKQDTMPFSKRQQELEAAAAAGVITADKQLPLMGVEPTSNGLTEAPCGRCPVFELCEEGGPVSPGNCVYFQRWLGLED